MGRRRRRQLCVLVLIIVTAAKQYFKARHCYGSKLDHNTVESNNISTLVLL